MNCGFVCFKCRKWSYAINGKDKNKGTVDFMIRKYIQLLLYEVLPNTGGLEAKVIILYFFPGSNSNSLTWPLCQRNEEHKSTHVVDRFVECVFNLDRGLARAFFSSHSPRDAVVQGLRTDLPSTSKHTGYGYVYTSFWRCLTLIHST